MIAAHVFSDVVHVGGHADVRALNALGEPGGAAGVENVGQILPRIDRRLSNQGWVRQHRSEGNDPVILFDFPGRYLVEKHAQISFPRREKIRHVCHNHPFQAGFGRCFLDVAIIGVHADGGFDTGVCDHIGDLVGGIDRRYRYDHGANLLDAQKSDDPLDGVGDVNHYPVALADAQAGQGTGETLAQVLQAAV